MSTENAVRSPKFRNLCYKHNQSPKELKDKMRKSYRDKVKTCRDMLIDRFRGPIVQEDISNTLAEIYKNMISSYDNKEADEIEVLEELKNELIQEELEWWLKEYEKSQMDNVDWSTIEEDDSVICPVCQKSNFELSQSIINCTNCKFSIKTARSLAEIKKSIVTSVEKHNTACSSEPQFSIITEANDVHVFLICVVCSEMHIIL